jgi:fructose-bisphosphate aldolase class II
MNITRMDTLMQEARAQGRAVAAFECWDSSSIQAITIAAQRTGAPVIIQASPPEYEYCGGADALKAMVDWYTAKAGITAALHLDHGSTLEQVEECLRAGFSSVMLDGSRHPYERNLELTRAAAIMAHEYDASAEGELGHVGGLEGDLEDEDPGAAQTDPQQARAFAADTGVDCLAVAIGTVHGVYKGTPRINLERLRDIAAAVPLPLVLHGGSGTPDDTLRECIRLGVAKINICTELQQAWTAGIAESVRTLAIGAPGRFYTPARERLIQVMVEKIRLFSLI